MEDDKDDKDNKEKPTFGNGSDLVLTVFNRATNETIVLDAAKDGEQFVLTMAKAGSSHTFMAICCGTKFMVDHLLHQIQENKDAFIIALVIGLTTGMIDPQELRNVKAHKIDMNDILGGFNIAGPDKDEPPKFH